MIIFGDCSHKPFAMLKACYDKAYISEKAIEAMCLSTIDLDKKKPYSRYINIKYIDQNKLIFFTNFNSNKATQISNVNSVSCVFYWSSIHTQIRIEGSILKCSNDFSDNHFKNRSAEKNALAISSNQSKTIQSYEKVIDKYNITLSNYAKQNERPSYWGGYEIKPDYFEFWTGKENRLNLREEFKLVDAENGFWSKGFLEP